MEIPNMRCFVIKEFVDFKFNIYSVNLKDIDFLFKPSLSKQEKEFFVLTSESFNYWWRQCSCLSLETDLG